MAKKQKQLIRRDLQNLQNALVELYSDVSQSTLAARTIKFAETILPHNFVSFDFFDENNILTQVLWSNFGKKPTAEEFQHYIQNIHENPLHNEVVVKKRLDPVILTDLIAIEDFLQTSVYKKFHSLADAKFMMAVSLWISSGAMMTCIFWNGDNDFSERDRLILAHAAPHLINAVRSASDFNHLTSALEVKNSGVLSVDSDGKIQSASEFVQRIWSKYFAGEVQEASYISSEILAWMKINELSSNELPPKYFQMQNENGELSIRFVTNDRRLGKTLLFEEKRTISPEALEILNLTKREAEILFWMSQGKSDRDIAEICGVSPLTVHKHAQNIYSKLGVENRSAAMLAALEILL